MSKLLPPGANLEFYKKEAKRLLANYRAQKPRALALAKKYQGTASASFSLHDAQLVIARQHQFPSWAKMKAHIEFGPVKQALLAALEGNDLPRTREILAEHPALLHENVRSIDWGPPMAVAALCGHEEMVRELRGLGARDVQKAFGRSLLRGNASMEGIARFLISEGADPKADPGNSPLFGTAETLNANGFRFLLGLGLDPHPHKPNPDGTSFSTPLGWLFGAYVRQPPAKAECLSVLWEAGVRWPDTPVTAIYANRPDLLIAHLRQDPELIHRRLSQGEIFLPELGYTGGAEWAPLVGGTLLHLALDQKNLELAQLLLGEGADINARALVAEDGIGGHPPTFHAVIDNTTGDVAAATTWCLDRGADLTVRATLRQLIPWMDEPPLGERFPDVTPLDFATRFVPCNFANLAAIPILKERGGIE